MNQSEFSYSFSMTSYEEAFFAGAYSEQFANSSPFDSIWSSSYPHFLTSSGECYYNYLDETYYYAISTPVFFGDNDYVYSYPGAYQYVVPITYDYQVYYYYTAVSYNFQENPVVNQPCVAFYYVPLVYYIPVYPVPVTYSFDDVHSQYYSTEQDLINSSTFECSISETSDGSVRNYSPTSEECSTFEIFYKEEGEHLNDAHFNDDDKRENNDDKSDSSDNSDDDVSDVHTSVQYSRPSVSCNNTVRLTTDVDGSDEELSSSQESDLDKKDDTETKSFKSVLDLSVGDYDYLSLISVVYDSCGEYLPPQESDLNEKEDSEIKEITTLLDDSQSIDQERRLKTDVDEVDESDEELSSSQEIDLDKKEDTEIKSFKSVLDLSVGDDDYLSLISIIHASCGEYLSPQESDLDEKENSAIKEITTLLDDSQSIDDQRRSQGNFDTSKLEATDKNIPGSFNEEISKSKSQRLKEKILTSKEYADIQENLEYSEHYKHSLYKLALERNPRRNNDILLDYLPSVIEEDLVPVSEEDENVENVSSHPSESVTIDNDDGSNKESKQQKKRFRSVRKFLSRVFSCCTKKPPP